MKKLLVVFASLALMVQGFAQNPLPVDKNYKIGKLDNGLTYYIRHNDKPAQRCEFYLVTDAGAINEGPGQDGLAHFLEHMCFNGLDNLPGKQMLDYFQSIGASFGGNINAGTGVEATTYMLNDMPIVREGIIDTCLLVMHDYSHFVTMAASEIEAERGVILEEKRTRNTAWWREYVARGKYFYPGTKYADTDVIGSENTLKTFTRETLQDFYHSWYRPDKQAVIVVGDIDPDAIERKLKAVFADIPAPVNPKEMEPIVVADNAEPIIGVFTDPEITNNSCTIIYRHPSIPKAFRNTDQVYMLNLVSDLVYYVEKERFDEIASKPGAPFDGGIVAFTNLIKSTDAVYCRASFKNGKDAEAINALLYQIEKLKRYGVTEAELERAKSNILSALEKEVEGAETRKNPQFINGVILAFLNNAPLMDPKTEFDFATLLCKNINAALVNQILKQYLNDKNMTVFLSGSGAVEHPDKDQILKMVEASRVAEVEAPAVEKSNLQLLDASKIKAGQVKKVADGFSGSKEWVLSNGLKVVILPTEYKKDEIKLSLRWQGGKSLLPVEALPSVSSYMWNAYTGNSGLGSLTSTELSKVLAGKIASASPWMEDDVHGISASSSPKDIETALQMMYLLIREPRFQAEDFQVGLDQIKAMLPNLEKNPMYQLSKRFPAAIYEPTDRRFALTPEVVAKADIKYVEQSYRKLFSDVAGAVLYVVGNVDVNTFRPLVEKYIASLPKGKKAQKYVPENVSYRKGAVEERFTTKMETPKVTVCQLYNAEIPATVENRLSLNAVSYVLDMLYVDTLREEEGGTYGASANDEFERRPKSVALIQVTFDTNEQQAPKLESIAKNVLKDLAAGKLSDEYFNRTLEFYKTKLPQKRINNNYWMGVLRNHYEWNENYDVEYEAAINALTKEKICSMAAAILASGNISELVMSPEK